MPSVEAFAASISCGRRLLSANLLATATSPSDRMSKAPPPHSKIFVGLKLYTDMSPIDPAGEPSGKDAPCDCAKSSINNIFLDRHHSATGRKSAVCPNR